ncbi:MAG: hypothetical protein RBR40_09595 [Tenuifilaceae bacterium]|nr:hypothetical protein [Tenuifilaceae bacterium]
MVTKVFIHYSNGIEVRNRNGTPLSDFCTTFSYSYVEGVENDKCELDVVFENYDQANSFFFKTGMNYLIRYGTTSNLSSYRNVALDKIEKTVTSGGIKFSLLLIPLVEYANKNYSSSNMWENAANLVADGFKHKFKLPYEVISIEKYVKDAPSGSYVSPGVELGGSIWNIQNPYWGVLYTGGDEAALRREAWDVLMDPQTNARGFLKQYKEYSERYAGLVVDARDDYIIVKEKDLEKGISIVIDGRGLLSGSGGKKSNIDELISYELSESDKGIATESMVQTVVDLDNKETQVTKVTSLSDRFVGLPIMHIGGNRPEFIKQAGDSTEFSKGIVTKVLTDGESFYVRAGKNLDEALRLDPEQVEIIRGQLNYTWEVGVARGGNYVEPSNWGYTDTKLFSKGTGVLGEDMKMGWPQKALYNKLTYNGLPLSEKTRNLLLHKELEPTTNEPNQFFPYSKEWVSPAYEGLDRPVTSKMNQFFGGDRVYVDDSIHHQQWQSVPKFFGLEPPTLEELKASMAKRLPSTVETNFALNKQEIINKLVKQTTEDALSKNKLSITMVGRVGLSVSDILYFNSGLAGESGKYYIVKIEDRVSPNGFITKIEALKVPKDLSGISEQITRKVDGNWEDWKSEGVKKLMADGLAEIDNIIEVTNVNREYGDFFFAEDLEITIEPGAKELDPNKGPNFYNIRNTSVHSTIKY